MAWPEKVGDGEQGGEQHHVATEGHLDPGCGDQPACHQANQASDHIGAGLARQVGHALDGGCHQPFECAQFLLQRQAQAERQGRQGKHDAHQARHHANLRLEAIDGLSRAAQLEGRRQFTQREAAPAGAHGPARSTAGSRSMIWPAMIGLLPSTISCTSAVVEVAIGRGKSGGMTSAASTAPATSRRSISV